MWYTAEKDSRSNRLGSLVMHVSGFKVTRWLCGVRISLILLAGATSAAKRHRGIVSGILWHRVLLWHVMPCDNDM